MWSPLRSEYTKTQESLTSQVHRSVAYRTVQGAAAATFYPRSRGKQTHASANAAATAFSDMRTGALTQASCHSSAKPTSRFSIVTGFESSTAAYSRPRRKAIQTTSSSLFRTKMVSCTLSLVCAATQSACTRRSRKEMRRESNS